MNLLKFLKGIRVDPKRFDSDRERLGWADLARNEVVMNYLRNITRIGLDDIRELLLQPKDKQNLLKAQIYGDMRRVADLIEKSELALKELNKK